MPEVFHRARELARKQSTRRSRQGWARYRDGSTEPPALPGMRRRFLAAPEALRQAVAEAACAFLGGQFSALGAEWPTDLVTMDFPGSLWRLDPVNRGQWPDAGTYCFEVSYRLDARRGDIKHVWEFGRLQFLPVLAADVLLHGRKASHEAIVAAIDSWYEHNPPFGGVHWAELLNVAIRSVNVLVALSLCGERLPDETVQRARTLLRAHAALLALFPSLHSSANNHLVAELTAEYLIAVAMPEMPGAAQTRSHALGRLVREAQLQILPDGAPAEQSPSYGAFTVEFLLLAHVVAADAGDEVDPAAAQRLSAFAAYVEALSAPDGRVPLFGDNDEGRVVSLCRHEPQYPLSVAAMVRAWLQEPLHSAVRPPPELRHALTGWPAHAGSPATGQRTFGHGGLSVDRRVVAGRQCLLTFDHGPLGYLSIAAHGHADALAVTLNVDGIAVLVDPGTYLYHAGGAWRDWFRGTPAHNTLNIEGEDQSRMAGPFNWSSKARVLSGDSREGPDWRWQARHDGFRTRFGVEHERTIEPTADGYLIVDRLLGAAAPGRAVECVFQLGPTLSAALAGHHCTVLQGRHALLALTFPEDGVLCCRRGGELGSGGGWVSDRFGVRVAADRLSWRGRCPPEGLVVRVQVMPWSVGGDR